MVMKKNILIVLGFVVIAASIILINNYNNAVEKYEDETSGVKAKRELKEETERLRDLNAEYARSL
jgi:hypothetical protein